MLLLLSMLKVGLYFSSQSNIFHLHRSTLKMILLLSSATLWLYHSFLSPSSFYLNLSFHLPLCLPSPSLPLSLLIIIQVLLPCLAIHKNASDRGKMLQRDCCSGCWTVAACLFCQPGLCFLIHSWLGQMFFYFCVCKREIMCGCSH